MSNNKAELVKIMDFILNRSSLEELFIIEKGIERRKDDLQTGRHILNLKQSAHQTSEVIQQQIGSLGDIKSMAKKFIEQMVKQAMPDIPEEHLNILLKEWLPQTEKTNSSPKRQGLPPDIIASMAVQFVDYSLGRMRPEEKTQLKPNWSKQYWDNFPPEIQHLLANFITSKITEKQFWDEFRKLNS